ncbi:pyridoxal phosphate-dependent transferase [Stachybotrys elegans]|uniref:Pyridoxal phosphate-dependent transferase n=1 Tax=Stachybotrys elegans TaxID=80388 RepID=A0A8K0WU70_9HYPO|nr:pyridoxal phosphate-dependent transferase [Stachybotrys elegans]
MGEYVPNELPVRAKSNKPLPLGGALKAEFPFDPEWRNLNHGSFGTFPTFVQEKLREYQTRCEARPDKFIRYEYPALLDASRAAAAEILHAPVETVVFHGNATEGVNTVLRNLVWAEDGKDVIITFTTAYEACAKAADFLEEYYEGKVQHREIQLVYPIEDDAVVAKFRDTVKALETEGKRARICLFDVVSSRPGIVFPHREMIKACKELGVLSLVDGAHSIGLVPLNLPEDDPDFFTSNCHKWLHTPRGCSVFYVPLRNQHLIRTALGTSHGYMPKAKVRGSPLPPSSSKTPFEMLFQFVGTRDNTPYLCVKDAVQWRREVLGGEDRIRSYIWDLNKKGSRLVAEELGTHVLSNSTGTALNCGMANIALPIWVGDKGAGARESDVVLPKDKASAIFNWMLETFIAEYKTFVVLYADQGRFWTRLSSQVYLDLEDYRFAAKALGEMVERLRKEEYKGKV